MTKPHLATDLIQIFAQCFGESHNTELVLGDDEPIYLPANVGCDTISASAKAQVVFAHGYFTSALHEVAHWCLAGEQRRLLLDYGYWYAPDGRSAEQQRQFEQVEVKPQAIEMAFSRAAGIKFNVSCDNLAGDEYGRQPDHRAFYKKVEQQYNTYVKTGFPARAQVFIEALARFYQTETVPLVASC